MATVLPASLTAFQGGKTMSLAHILEQAAGTCIPPAPELLPLVFLQGDIHGDYMLLKRAQKPS